MACSFFAARGGLKTVLLGETRPGLGYTAAAAMFTLGWPSLNTAALSGLLQNYVFQVGFVAWFSAQFMKIFTYKARKGKWRLKAFVDSGGMPSSHSSLCTGVTTAVGMLHGFSSTMFAVSLCFSLIVMYDAAGVRRHAGKQAEVLNMIIKDLWEGHPVSEQQLKKVLKSPGATEHGPSEHAADKMVDDRQLTLYSYSSRSFDESDPGGMMSSHDGAALDTLVAVQEEVKPQCEMKRKYKLERLEQVNRIRSTITEQGPKLKEVLGHTPLQVICGAALGVFVGLCMPPVV